MRSSALNIASEPSNQQPPHARYAFKPLAGSSHSWALKQLSPHIDGRSLLDVGAGSGWLGRCVKPLNPRRTVAVEIDRRSHDTLNAIYDCVESEIAELASEKFDCIALLDVLEHLPRPAEFLSKLRLLLAPSGIILLSVPNVAHWSVRFPLFFLGRFEYSPLGILDQTHLQFFTRQSFLGLCRSTPDCTIETVSASIEPFELALPRWLWSNPLYQALLPARISMAGAFPGLLAYQHLAVLRAKASHTQP